MKIKRIQIDFDLETDQIPHAEYVVFEGGTWTADGPLYSRVLPVLHEIWRLVGEIAGRVRG